MTPGAGDVMNSCHAFGGSTGEPRPGPERPETARRPAAPNRDAIQAASRPSVTRGGAGTLAVRQDAPGPLGRKRQSRDRKAAPAAHSERDSGRLAAKRYGRAAEAQQRSKGVAYPPAR